MMFLSNLKLAILVNDLNFLVCIILGFHGIITGIQPWGVMGYFLLSLISLVFGMVLQLKKKVEG